MTRQEIEERTIRFLVEEFEADADEIQPDAPLTKTLGLDSLDFVDLVVFIDTHFGIKVKPEDFQQMKTFNDFYSFIERHVAVS